MIIEWTEEEEEHAPGIRETERRSIPDIDQIKAKEKRRKE